VFLGVMMNTCGANGQRKWATIAGVGLAGARRMSHLRATLIRVEDFDGIDIAIETRERNSPENMINNSAVRPW